MREIKFRVFHLQEKRMMYVSEMQFISNNTFCLSCNENDGRGWVNVQFSPLMQYTSIKDKNKTEVYEGDLIRVNLGATATYEVRFENGEYCLYNFQFKELGKWGSIGSLHSACESLKTDFEIIGNIHQVKQ